MTAFRFPAPLRIAALALFCAWIAACGGNQESGGRSESAVTVTTTRVALESWNDTIQALGTVKARESVMITAKVSETVDQVHFDSGDQVREGDVLVTLSGGQQRAALQAAEAAATEAERMYRRQSELARQQLIASSLLDTQLAVRDSARAQVQEIRAHLSDRSIRAPFGGVLGIRQISPGSLVQPGTVIASLDDISRVYVDFPVPEAQLANLASGQNLIGSSSAYPGREFTGTVATIDSRIDPATRAVTVRGEFPNPGHALRPGMLVRVWLERATRDALVVPEISVVQVGRETFVYRVLDDDTVEQVPIVVGARASGRAEVAEGLRPGDRIVVDGTGKLRPGLAVTDVGPPEAPPAEGGTDDDAVAPTALPPVE